jgi:hypothetical protein
MTQLKLVYKKNKYDIEFQVVLDAHVISKFDYELECNTYAHLKIIKKNFEQFTNEFTAGCTSIRTNWHNDDSADITLYCSNGAIGMCCESKESSSSSFSIPIVDKTAVIANLNEIIEKLNEQIKTKVEKNKIKKTEIK